MGIGDELMVTGHVRVLQQTDPRKVKLVYERATHWSEVFENNPRIARIGEQGDFQTFVARTGGIRPYCSAKTDAKWTWREYKPLVGELFFTDLERYFADQATKVDIVVEPTTKHRASPNKDWGWERWQALVHRIHGHGLKVGQMGPPGTKILNGARHVITSTFRQAAAYLSRVKAAVLHEGGLHHAAAAVGVRAVVIYGGYISPAQTGYDMHANLFTGGTPCGLRTRCGHCREAMQNISPDDVFARLKTLLS